VIRDAGPGDLEAIAAIYNREVATSLATLDTEPMAGERLGAFAARHRSPRYPLRVAIGATRVIGWAALSPWSDRCGYARAAEVSVYVAEPARGRGLGRVLLEDLIAHAKEAGVAVLLARIVAGRDASLALHRRLGFTEIGVMRRVGEKFGEIVDVVLLELHLDLESRV
jgi:phosphinothricin acetyltransferase